MQPELQAVLDWVNKIRDLRGIGPALDALPKGERASSCGCPVASALRASCTNGSAWWPEMGMTDNDFEDFPFEVRKFTVDFDNGAYPELIA